MQQYFETNAFYSWSMAPSSAGSAEPCLRVSANHRWIEYTDGTPFFWLGDTAWELFHRLNREEADLYLENRAHKGFTVIQAVALAEQDGLNTPNAYGHRPFLDNDPARPDEDYWRDVDAVVNTAASRGLFIGMLPTWGDKWQPVSGKARPLFTAENAGSYGEWLGRRYRNSRVIWILGGDRNIHSDADHRLIAAMANGLRSGDDGKHLITYHPLGPGRSSDYFHREEWLDLNMVQSSHAARDHDNGLFADHDYALDPPKPTLDGEPRYEALRVGFYNRDVARNLYFDDYDARQAAWWSLLAGACGHTYGNNNIWQMWQPGRNPVLGANTPWHVALDHPGAFQMGHIRRLFESRPFTRLVPDQAMLLDAPRHGGAKVRAARAADGSFAFVYSPRGEQFSIDQGRMARGRVRVSWYDPRYGTAFELHTGDSTAIQTFVPPSAGRGQDWVLVLDAAEAGFALPGTQPWTQS